MKSHFHPDVIVFEKIGFQIVFHPGTKRKADEYLLMIETKLTQYPQMVFHPQYCLFRNVRLDSLIAGVSVKLEIMVEARGGGYSLI